jgi:4-amino-4-deoxy-L-arabinose transferase-like glycosyltransferase
MTKIFNSKNTIIFVALIAVWKAFLSYGVQLHPDEAYYWLWSHHLAPGYYDHAPMVAYFIKLTTLFTQNELAVRFSSIIVTVVLSYFIYRLTKKMFATTVISSVNVTKETVASAAVIILNTLPIMLTGSIIITPDTPLLLFYGFTLIYLWNFINNENKKYLYFMGVFYGLALLSKYTAVLFLPCLFLYMLADRKLYWFKNIHFYGAFAVALLILMPVLYWNFKNGWVSFLYQLNHGLYNTGYNFNRVGEYLSAQALVFGPLIFIPAFLGGIGVFFKSLLTRDARKLFLLSFALPPIIFFMFTALKRTPGANWPAFGYITLSVFAAYYLLSGGEFKKKLLTWGITLSVFLSVIVGLHAKYTIIPVQKFSKAAAIADATNWLSGWTILTDELLKEQARFVITTSHQRAATIAYYTKNKVLTTVSGKRPNQFAYWTVPESVTLQKTFYVEIDNRMEEDFSSIPGAKILQYYRYGMPVRQYAVRSAVVEEVPSPDVENNAQTEQIDTVAVPANTETAQNENTQTQAPQ